MTDIEILKQFGITPINKATLKLAFAEYKSIKDKIAALEQSGFLIRLKRGLFVVAPIVHNQVFSKELIANHIYGTSYISLQSALSFYGLIPERVHTVCSISIKRSRSFQTPIGNFDYSSVPTSYFSIGLRQEIINNEYAFLIASPEKALCDMIVQTSGLKLQSIKAMRTYLEKDLRVDLSMIEHYDIEIIKQCIEQNRKSRELTLLYKLLQK